MMKLSDYRERLIDRMTRVYSLEHPIVFEFCEYCERLENSEENDAYLAKIVYDHESNPKYFESFLW